MQKQVDQLVLANKKKTEWIKQIDRDLDGMNQFCKSNTETIYERLDDLKTNEDEDKEVAEVELDEKVVDEDLRERAQIFIKRSLTTLENMEEDVKQCRKNGKDVREKYRFYCNQIIKDGSEELDTNVDRHKNCMNIANEMKSVLENAEMEQRKFDKDDCLKTIDSYRTRLTLCCANLDSIC